MVGEYKLKLLQDRLKISSERSCRFVVKDKVSDRKRRRLEEGKNLFKGRDNVNKANVKSDEDALLPVIGGDGETSSQIRHCPF